MNLVFKVDEPKKHSVRFKAVEAWQDGEPVAQDITERFTIYVPNDVLFAIGWKKDTHISIELKV